MVAMIIATSIWRCRRDGRCGRLYLEDRAGMGTHQSRANETAQPRRHRIVRAGRDFGEYESPMAAYETKVIIRFEDADPAGIVFYPRAIALAHSVVEDLIRQTQLGWHGWFENHGLAAPVRHAEADFVQPMRAGETLLARAWVDQLGETSGTFAVEFSGQENDLRARIRTVHVLIDRGTKNPVALTPEVRQALEPFRA